MRDRALGIATFLQREAEFVERAAKLVAGFRRGLFARDEFTAEIDRLMPVLLRDRVVHVTALVNEVAADGTREVAAALRIVRSCSTSRRTDQGKSTCD